MIAVAVVVGAWLALGYRADRLEGQGWEAFTRTTPRESLDTKLARAGRLLHRARRFNADPSPLLREGFMFVYTGRDVRARAAARRVVAQEPDNLDGWRLLYMAASGPASAAQARRMVKALDPWAAATLR
jgi:hypothetical protein